MQLLKTSDNMTINFYPNQPAARVKWELGNAYAIYSCSDSAVISANACYNIIASIRGIEISKVEAYLKRHCSEINWQKIWRKRHDIFFERQAEHVLAQYAHLICK